MKKQVKKICVICRRTRKTTNEEFPFVCENPCLRVEARKLLLETNTVTNRYWRGLVIAVVVFMAGLILGSVLF